MLHIIRHSPFDSQCLNHCLAIFSLQDSLLLIENGVFCALAETTQGEKLTCLANSKNLFVLKPHAAERGILTRVIQGVKWIDFEEFVDLTVEQERILQW